MAPNLLLSLPAVFQYLLELLVGLLRSRVVALEGQFVTVPPERVAARKAIPAAVAKCDVQLRSVAVLVALEVVPGFEPGAVTELSHDSL